MSVYNPPNFEEYLSVFNPANWLPPSAGEIDTAYLDANYLRFPSAQGSENLLNTSINGDLTIDGNLTIDNNRNLISFTDTTTLTNLLLHGNNPPIPTTATLSNCQVAGYGVFQNHTNKIINSCIAIGSSVLRNATNVVSANPEINNIGIGTNSLATLVNSPNFFGYNTGSNIGIGLNAMDGLLNGENNTYMGHQQIGLNEKLIQGNRNTFLGSDTSISSVFSGNCNNSTAVGYGAQITANNQVMLGRNTEEVYIPNLIRFTDGSSINSNTLNYTFSGLTPPYSFSTSYELLNKMTYLSTTAVGTITWINPNDSNASNKLCTIFNTGQFQINLTITSGVFSGKYGSGGTQLIVPVGCWVQIYSDGTNWRVDDRSSNFNINLYSATTSFNWSSDFQYLDNQIELVPADDALNTSANITGGGTMSGYVFTFVSLSGTGLGAGSIFSVNTSSTRKYTILCQVSGNIGGLGSYLCNFAGDYSTTVAITIRPNFTTNSNGNLTQGALTTHTGIYSTATFTTGTPFAGMTVGVPTATVMGNIPFYVINQNSGTLWNVSSNSTGSLGSTAWWGNRGNTITLPNPSASLIGRTFTLINNSGTMTNITSSGGTALFGGRYGQMILNTATVASNYPVGAFPTNYLLRPSQTVVLRCDGTQWETQEGTTIGEQRSYVNNIAVSTSIADGTVANYPLYNFDQTYSNLSGLINITNGTSPAWCNLFPFPITLQLTFSLTWASVAVAGTTLPTRNIIITCFGAGTNGFTSTNSNTITIPCSVASPNFTTIAGDNTQCYTTTITLRSFEVFTVNISKRDGTGTARTTGFSSMFVKRLS